MGRQAGCDGSSYGEERFLHLLFVIIDVLFRLSFRLDTGCIHRVRNVFVGFASSSLPDLISNSLNKLV